MDKPKTIGEFYEWMREKNLKIVEVYFKKINSIYHVGVKAGGKKLELREYDVSIPIDRFGRRPAKMAYEHAVITAHNLNCFGLRASINGNVSEALNSV